jgi:4-hydroxyphenylacetate 3-monooxygenase
MDAVVIFDDVFVPWENVVLYRDIKRCNEAYARTGAVVHMTHQVVVKNIAKCEFMPGLPGVESAGCGAQPLPALVSTHGGDHSADWCERPGGHAPDA